jgi:hypothetical protein
MLSELNKGFQEQLHVYVIRWAVLYKTGKKENTFYMKHGPFHWQKSMDLLHAIDRSDEIKTLFSVCI